MEEYNVQKSIELQRELCKDKIRFAPDDGYCYYCCKQIYKGIEHIGSQGRINTTGIPTDVAGKTVITGCPHCNHTFCD